MVANPFDVYDKEFSELARASARGDLTKTASMAAALFTKCLTGSSIAAAGAEAAAGNAFGRLLAEHPDARMKQLAAQFDEELAHKAAREELAAWLTQRLERAIESSEALHSVVEHLSNREQEEAYYELFGQTLRGQGVMKADLAQIKAIVRDMSERLHLRDATASDPDDRCANTDGVRRSGRNLRTGIIRLRDLWREKHAVGSEGGFYDLLGLAQDSYGPLLRFFHALERDQGGEVRLAYREGLFPTLADEACIRLVRVCKSLDDDALAGALSALMDVVEICTNHMPELLPCIRLQMLHPPGLRAPNLDDMRVERLLPNVAPELRHLLVRVIAKAEPFRPFVDQRSRLRVSLYLAGIRRPQALIDASIERLLELLEPVDQEGARRRVAERLASDYDASPRQDLPPHMARLLDGRDVATTQSSEAPRAVRRTSSARLEHVALGLFRRRPVLERVTVVCRHWLAGLLEPELGPGEASFGSDQLEPPESDAPEDGLPVFWIAGRSGEGKSVLLLQLVTELLRDMPMLPIVQVASGRKLGQLLAALSAAKFSLGAGQRTVVVVDEMYNVEDRDGLHEQLRDACGSRALPIAVVTCGPTEQYERCSKELLEALAIERFTLPPIEQEEVADFVEWHNQRTGQELKLSDVTRDNTLLVLLMWELDRRQALGVFAAHFKTRLEQIGIFEVVRDILAVNALYMHAPVELIPDEASRDWLERLSQDDQLHFERRTEEIEGRRRDSVRLNHSKLAWLLLQAWCDSQGQLLRGWACCLSKTLDIYLGQPGGRAYANAILTQVYHTPLLRDEPSAGHMLTRHRLVEELYAAHLGRCATPNPQLLPRWLHLSYTVQGLELLPDPTARAMALLRDKAAPPELLAETAKWAWLRAEHQGEERRQEVVHLCAEYLTSDGSGEAAIKEAADLCRRSKSPATVRLAQGLWNRNPADPGNDRLLHALVWAGTEHSGDGQLARWLECVTDADRVYAVINVLLQNKASAADVTAGIRWWSDNPEHAGADHILWLLAMRHREEPAVARVSAQWLDCKPNHPRARDVVSVLFVSSGATQQHFDLAMKWVGERADPAAALHLFHKHVRQLAPAKVWIQKHAQDRLCPSLLTAVLRRWPEDESLCATAERRIKHDPRYNVSGPLLRAWLRSSPRSPRKLNRWADKWLLRNGECPEACEVLAALMERGCASDLIVHYAQRWWERNPTSAQLPVLLSALVGVRLESVLEEVRDWLRTKADGPECGRVIKTLLEQYRETWVFELTDVWLSHNWDHAHTPGILSKLLEAAPNEEDSLNQALKWLDQHRGHDSEHRLFGALIARHGEHVEVVRRAEDMLERSPDSAVAEKRLRQLLRANLGQERLAGRLLDWLERAHGSVQSSELAEQIAYLVGTHPVAVRLCARWLDENRENEAGFRVLGRAIVSADDVTEWVQLGEERLPQTLTVECFPLLGGLVLGSRASARFVETALAECMKRDPSPETLILRRNLGNALLLNPRRGVAELQERCGDTHAAMLQQCMADAICQREQGISAPQEVSEFFELAHRALEPDCLGLIYYYVVKSGYEATWFDSMLVAWLQLGRGGRVYQKLLGKFAGQPEHWARLVKLGVPGGIQEDLRVRKNRRSEDGRARGRGPRSTDRTASVGGERMRHLLMKYRDGPKR